MVLARERWLGVRMSFLISLLTCAVALGAIFVSQDAGRSLIAKSPTDHLSIEKFIASQDVCSWTEPSDYFSQTIFLLFARRLVHATQCLFKQAS